MGIQLRAHALCFSTEAIISDLVKLWLPLSSTWSQIHSACNPCTVTLEIVATSEPQKARSGTSMGSVLRNRYNPSSSTPRALSSSSGRYE